MNDDFPPLSAGPDAAAPQVRVDTLGASTLYKLCEEVIQLREKNDRQSIGPSPRTKSRFTWISSVECTRRPHRSSTKRCTARSSRCTSFTDVVDLTSRRPQLDSASRSRTSTRIRMPSCSNAASKIAGTLESSRSARVRAIASPCSCRPATAAADAR